MTPKGKQGLRVSLPAIACGRVMIELPVRGGRYHGKAPRQISPKVKFQVVQEALASDKILGQIAKAWRGASHLGRSINVATGTTARCATGPRAGHSGDARATGRGGPARTRPPPVRAGILPRKAAGRSRGPGSL